MAMARINAMVEQEYLDKLETLKNQQRRSITQILKSAIDAYYEAHVAKADSQKYALLSSGFIACGGADADLSECYKQALAESLANKYDHR